jgi:hypothetical protein
MPNDEHRDQPAQPGSSAGVNHVEKQPANPARPQPSSDDAPSRDAVEHVEADAMIEDRFEATDN